MPASKQETGLTEKEKRTDAHKLEVIPLQEALNRAQQLQILEGLPGDHVVRIFKAVQGRSENFSEQTAPPTCQELSSQLGVLEEDSCYKCLTELSGLGQNKDPLIAALPSLRLINGGMPKPECELVYVRPGSEEGRNTERYVNEIRKRNIETLASWSALRPSWGKAEQSSLLSQALQNGQLLSAQMQKSISDLFCKKISNSPGYQRIIYYNFVRPTIQRLIQRGILILYKTELSGTAIQALYWNRDEELSSWYVILLRAYNNDVVPSLSPLHSEEPLEVSQEIQTLLLESLNAVQRQIIQELYLICHFFPTYPKAARLDKPKKKEKKTDVNDLISFLAHYPGIVDGEKLKAEPQTLALLRSANSVLHTRYPLFHKIKNFYLHKSRITDVLQAARRDMQQKDSTYFLILSALKIREYLNSSQLQTFQELELRALLKSLPWYIRLLRALYKKKILKLRYIKILKEKEQKTKKKKMQKIERRIDQKSYTWRR